MTEQLNVQQMAQRLMTADNILILCHKNPDGDTIGCGSALYCALKMLDKEAAVLCSDAIPTRYAFTNGNIKREYPADQQKSHPAKRMGRCQHPFGGRCLRSLGGLHLQLL